MCFIKNIFSLCAAKGNVEYFWNDPRKVGSLVTDTDGSKFYRGKGFSTSNYITHDRLKSRNFIKGHDVIFLLSLEGLCFLFSEYQYQWNSYEIWEEFKRSTSSIDVTGLLKTQTRRPKIRDLRLEIDGRDAEEEPKRQMVVCIHIAVFSSHAWELYHYSLLNVNECTVSSIQCWVETSYIIKLQLPMKMITKGLSDFHIHTYDWFFPKLYWLL